MWEVWGERRQGGIIVNLLPYPTLREPSSREREQLRRTSSPVPHRDGDRSPKDARRAVDGGWSHLLPAPLLP